MENNNLTTFEQEFGLTVNEEGYKQLTQTYKKL